MEISLKIKYSFLQRIKSWVSILPSQYWLLILSGIAALAVSIWSAYHGYTVVYGDSESHLNIAKRVVHSLTPGFAQLGGIWLPIPHLLMVPFVYFDFLWRTGLAGSIVSGIAYLISVLYIYKLSYLLTRSQIASFIAGLIFALNPNILYMQSTPMTEIPLICFFLLSSFYFIKFLEDDKDMLALLLAGFFTFCATLSRYDGWFLVGIQAGILGLVYFPWRRVPKSFGQIKTYFEWERWNHLEGKVILFLTVGFFGVVLWLLWDYLILGDPLYFTHSEFSAKSQQNAWNEKNMLPAYGHILTAFIYYFVTAMSNAGVLIYFAAIVGLYVYLFRNSDKHKWYVGLILLVPFIFNVLTLFLGQSVIFIPHISPVEFEWRLFNVRYGTMMVPAVAFLVGFLFWKSKIAGKLLIIGLCVAQFGLYYVGYSKVLSFEDGAVGLSSAVARMPDVQNWINKEYDGGLVWVDDYARTISIIRTNIPMQNIIYIGNRKYWDESFGEPEKYARWIIMQKNDALWKELNDKLENQGRVYKYFQKVYTSEEVLVFKRNPEVASDFDPQPSGVAIKK